MVAFNTPFLSFITAAILVTFVEAAPYPRHARRSVHQTRYIGKRSLKVENYYPKSTFEAFGNDGVTFASGSSLASGSLKDSAFAYLNTLGVSSDDIAYQSGLIADSHRVAHLKQSINGIPVANAVANVAFKGDTVISHASSFVDTKSANIAPAVPTVAWRSVLAKIEDDLEGKYNDWNVTLEYLARSDGSVALTYVVQIQNDETGAWYEAFVNAHSGELISVTDFVSDATYNAVPITKQSFADGMELIVNPEDFQSSPAGWHSVGFGNSTATSGNNVVAFRIDKVQAQSSTGLSFKSSYDDTKPPEFLDNIAAATTNAFFIANVVHDFAYRYGFTEKAFNFQLNNFGKGGKENDRVEISVQDNAKTKKNNANFASGADGQTGRCNMFVWNFVSPERDGSLQNDILIHELTHGITNRMTGGGTGRCLQTIEAGSMGEGWGDSMANWMSQNATTADFTVGGYVTGTTKGIRSHPYSVNKKTNPLTYSALKERIEVHAGGEVWANMLHNVYAALVDKHGFEAEKLTKTDSSEGNIVYMHLFFDSLALQPCNPTFVNSRDAWLQADRNRYNGEHVCTISKAFASRGLGRSANENFDDDFRAVDGCP